jgi:N-acetylglutamate synthase-like GNAT family acetyltransferase
MSKAGIQIRAARPAEADAIRRLVREAYAPYVSRIGREPAPMNADYPALVADGAVWVALNRGELVGVLVLREEPESLLLENVAVNPEAQGKGIGRALVNFAEQHARELGLPKVRLYTNALMSENLAFYPRLGYVAVSRRREDGFDRFFFEKALAPGE